MMTAQIYGSENSKWPEVSLSSVAEVTAGGPAPQEASDFSPNGIPFVRMQDVGRGHHCPNLTTSTDRITEETAKRRRLRLFPKGSLLIPKSGASVNLNHRGLLGVDSYVVSHLAVVIPSAAKVDSEYLYYWSLIYDPRRQAQVTSLPSLPLSLISKAQLPLPPLSEQHHIVDILKRADGIRRLRKQASQTARELIPALFVDMFGDPATNPKGWPVISCGELIADGPQNGLYKPSSDYGDGTPILRIDGFYDGAVSDWTSLRRLRISDQERAKYRLHEGDIVINRVNSPEYLGKSALITGLLEETVFESNMMRFAVDTARILPAYFIRYLQTSYVKSQILSGAKHAINQSSINQQDVRSLQVVVPPLAVQKKFVELTQNINAVGAQQQTAIVKSESAFASLLHRAFRGEL